ncbi:MULTISPECIES: 4'-phosphopantetheinyl transferase family protein [Flavobacterium]|uniref:4'-phosphopantetheinyl transferase superfamily protein n=1 Tax=Flavobacterium covae TaxID=2906076 RepID=A0ABW8PD93_9FLAO|nr:MULTISPECIES: 4'-phosphopantetheinyl transferase superfamily protein [Flavobacterium]AMA48220.1 4-phosphopantetheinyl transferase [Flavobacterium covae]AND63625.1 4-phosphopantetheinyl transferase [Flavobacterium covae]MCJ1808308.1 4'-phosphopantetheinyl transferase superfamily protein [Flavobacterium covae]OWP82335.1 4-phosphopantetheinyl transferase [Flavobacterium covae]POR23425.1 4-phosphopantetheinyl transferase [Flavobacterium columnare]
MPFYKEIYFSEDTTIYLWKTTETYNQLFENVLLKNQSLARLEKMGSEDHRKNFLGVRMLLQYCGYTDHDLCYDVSGKPILKSEKNKPVVEVSISHSGEFSALGLSNKPIGIDLEKIKEKVLRIAPRYMDMKHIENLSVKEQIQKAIVIWGIKESIFKIKNEVGISFPDHIFEDMFNLHDNHCKAQLRFKNLIEDFDIDFCSIEDYMLVCAYRS